MRIPGGQYMILCTINCNPSIKARVNNVVYAENAQRSLSGLGMGPFPAYNHPTYTGSQAWFTPISTLVSERFESDLTMFMAFEHEVDSLDVCRRVCYAFKQSMGQSGNSINSDELAQAMATNSSAAPLLTLNLNYDFAGCSFSCVPYDQVPANAAIVSNGSVITELTTSPTVDSSNPNLNGQRGAVTLADSVRHGITAATNTETANTLANVAHTTANAGRSLIGGISDGVNNIAGSNTLIKFAVYGLVIFAVVSATQKLIQTVKN